MQINTNVAAADAFRELASAQTSLAQPTASVSTDLAATEPAVTADTVDFEGKTRAVSTENTLAAASRLSNNAMAEQMVHLTRVSILAQPVTARSAQANQPNSHVMQLRRPAA